MSVIKYKSRRQKKYNGCRNNKTKKYRKMYHGGNRDNVEVVKHNRKGVVDYMGDKMSDLVSNTGSYLTTKTARLFGLKPISSDEKKTDEKALSEVTKSVSNTPFDITESVSNVASGITDSVNNGTASIIGDVNDVLETPIVSDTVKQAADDTKEITESLLEDVNETFDDPEFKKEVAETMENTAEIATIGIKAMDKPIDAAIDKVSDATGRAIGGIAGTGIKVATDIMAAVPFVGAVVEMGKIVNDTSKGISAVVEAGSEVAETSSDLVTDSIENFKDEYKKVEDLKSSINEKTKITNRVNDSIDDFEKTTKNPKEYLTGGGKTRKHGFKRNRKSKRVRFAI